MMTIPSDRRHDRVVRLPIARARSWTPGRLAVTVVLAGACSVYEPSLLAPASTPQAAGAAGKPVNDGGKSSGGAAAGAERGGMPPTTPLDVGGTSVGEPSNGGAPDQSAGGLLNEPSAGAGAGEAGAAGAATGPDDCPEDPNKVAPGTCGCGLPDVGTPQLASCTALKGKLRHRYDFEGTGTAVTDRIGTAHGALRGATLSKLEGRGVALLGGGSAGPYVDLPNGILSSLTDATLEAWVTWGGGAAWQRIFDFGDSSHASPENNPALGRTYLMLTAKSANGFAALGFSLTGNAQGQEQAVAAASALPTSLAHVVAVANATGNSLSLYIDGARVANATWAGSLSTINDVNAWLGRSQYDGDPELSGVFHEFRVYGSPLTEAEIASSFRAGPDPSFLSY